MKMKRMCSSWKFLILAAVILGCALLMRGTVEAMTSGTTNPTPSDLKQFSGMLVFTRDDCGYCKRLKPVLEILQKRHSDEVIKEVNATQPDENTKALMKTYQVDGFPTIKFFTNGEVAQTYNGERTESALESELKKTTS